MPHVYLPILGAMLAQVSSASSASLGSEWTPINVIGVLWVIGQIAVQIINAVRGNPVVQTQNAQISNLNAAIQGHDAQFTELSKDMLPPAVQAQMLQLVHQLAVKNGITPILGAGKLSAPQPAPAGNSTVVLVEQPHK